MTTTTTLVCEKIKYKICARGKSIGEINFFFIFTHFLFIFFRCWMITMMIKNFSNPEIDLKQTKFLFLLLLSAAEIAFLKYSGCPTRPKQASVRLRSHLLLINQIMFLWCEGRINFDGKYFTKQLKWRLPYNRSMVSGTVQTDYGFWCLGVLLRAFHANT